MATVVGGLKPTFPAFPSEHCELEHPRVSILRVLRGELDVRLPENRYPTAIHSTLSTESRMDLPQSPRARGQSFLSSWATDPRLVPALGVSLHWAGVPKRWVEDGVIYFHDHPNEVWGYVSPRLLLAGYRNIGDDDELLRHIGSAVRLLLRQSRPDFEAPSTSLKFAAIRKEGDWQVLFHRPGDWEAVLGVS